MDDILFEVLLRLPPRSLSRLKDVSPRWFHLINTSFFRENYSKRWRGNLNLLGFFVFNTQILMYQGKNINGVMRQLSSYWWPSTCTTTTTQPPDFLKGSGMGFFISTCNGLVLSGLPPNNYYVCNPVTNIFYPLPKCKSRSMHDCVAFWCKDSDNNLSINFNVIRANINYRMVNQYYRRIRIETFCSTTREWRQSTLRCSSHFRLCFSEVAVTVTRSGIILWKAFDKKLVIHDLNQVGDKDGTRSLTLIQNPSSSNDFIHSSYGEFSDGRLQYGECDSVGMQILILDKLQQNDGHYSYKWNVRYKISFTSMFTNNPTIYGCTRFYFLSLIPQNSESIFIRSESNKCFLYHLSTGKMEHVPYRPGPSLMPQYRGEETLGDYRIEPYYELLWPDLSF